MHSGIAPSQELASEFNKLLSDDSLFAVLATITGESVTPLATLPRSSSDFNSNLSQLTQYIKPNEPLYVLLRRYDDAPPLVAISYIPIIAPPRPKMMYASTRIHLVRELGKEHFRDTLLFTEVEELTPAGFERQKAHESLAAPLTEEERSLGEVKRLEAEASTGTGTRQIHMSNHFGMPVRDDAVQALQQLGQGEGRTLVMLKINSDDEAIDLVSDSSNPTSLPEAVAAISTTEPRFTFFRYRPSHPQADKDYVLFFYTNPSTTGTKAIKSRMLYPLQKRAVLNLAESECKCAPDKKFEIEDPNEITEDSVLSDLFPKIETKTAFRRPKRPGR
ncbi:actin depolymerizing protein [Xylariaceae sp. FL0255]|nr:actin depolymerizing protein [Xylariaceae sp. FL0255]